MQVLGVCGIIPQDNQIQANASLDLGGFKLVSAHSHRGETDQTEESMLQQADLTENPDAAKQETVHCPWANEEVWLVTSVQFRLLRRVRMHGTSPERMLKILINPLSITGPFRKHLEDPSSQHCRDRMLSVLEHRMETPQVAESNCLSWEELLTLGSQMWAIGEDSHAAKCSFCRSEIRWIRNNLPYYREVQ